MKSDYELLNEVKVDFNKYDNIEIDDLERRKIKKRLKGKIKNKKKSTKKIIIAASVILIVGTIGIKIIPVQATIEQLGNKLEEFFGMSNNKAYNDYKIVIGSSIEDKKITFTLNELLIKKDKAIINVKVDNRKFKSQQAITIFPDIYVDGEKVSEGGSTSLNYNEDGTYEMLHIVNIKDVDIDKDLKIDIEYLGGEYKQYGIERGLNGNWAFSINYNGEKIARDTKKIYINKDINIGNEYSYNINSIVISPVDVILKYNTTLMNEEKIINGEDHSRDISFTIMDADKNVIVKENGMNITGDMTTGDMEANMFLDSELKNKIIIVPYKVSYKKYDSIDEMIKDREYIFDESIEIELED
ncbi:DUF4179 domain-containing protein [Clostridium sp. DSM 100503]|uniref:DUF4179 domain-containing protein n=1 Tax=Clostridium sp. DSM 100503 TaxID=2963282 RepID=UPI00214A46D7|nr:DUF4179 domain-containing protein [Clostridium sp. DSM 100503]MCR1950519.1 DUF4179 domain-containing protein [Clostridium sp. DSM 100503]